MHIEVKRLNKHFGSFYAIKEVSFNIERGKLVGLLGPSGGGKTSILRMLSGLEKADSGHIYFNGEPADPLPVQQRGIGFVFQSYALFKHMTVFDNIAYGLRVKKKSKAFIQERVEYMLRVMGLEGAGSKYPHQLSGGQRQRVAFARALAPEPQLLLLDEPFAAIDAKIRKELRLWLRNLIDELGVTTLFVTHDQDEAMEVADEIIIVHQGQIEQQGSPWEIYTQPASAFVASFIGEMNRLPDDILLRGFEELNAYRQRGDWPGHATVMIRPEMIEVRPFNTHSNASAWEKARVTRTHFRGDRWYVELELSSGAKLFAYHPANSINLQQDEPVNVLIRELSVFSPAGRIVLFNQALGDPMPVFI